MSIGTQFDIDVPYSASALTELLPASTRGLLELRLRATGAADAARILLTDLQVVAKRAGAGSAGSPVETWVLDSHSLRGVSGAKVALIRPSGTEVASCTTGFDGGCRIEPGEPGSGYQFVNEVVGGVVPKEYIPAVDKGVQEQMENGVIAGFPVVDVKVTLYDGSYHDVDSSEMAFKIAGSLAFKEAMAQCKPILLEPIMNVEVFVPEENAGDIMGDLNSRRGRIQGMDIKGNTQVIRAQVPMSEMLRYAPDLSSMTGGRGTFTMEFEQYDEVPGDLAKKVIEQVNAEKE